MTRNFWQTRCRGLDAANGRAVCDAVHIEIIYIGQTLLVVENQQHFPLFFADNDLITFPKW